MTLFARFLPAAMILSAAMLASPALAWTSDNGNGTYTNPVLYGDYPDPDIIRVGNDFYLATTTFVSVPGIEILHSKDLINWEITGYAATTLDIDPKYSLIGGSQYSHGVWAPCLRYRNGTFYVIDNIQGAGTVICRATNPTGPWTMNRLDGYLYDPGLMFDDDGTPLVYHGTHGNISVAVLDSDLRKVVSVSPAYKLPDGEGSHAYKVNGMYYVFNSLYGPHPTLICSRSQSRTGPFTTVTVCNNGTPWAGPHQGGIVQLANGDWCGFSLSEAGSVGRTTWVGPVTWSDGWPYFGDPAAPSIPKTNKKPNVGGSFPIQHPATSDEFSGSHLGLQWQWNHNPDDAKWSLTARPGYLRLNTQSAPNYPSARNTLTLRTEGPKCTGTIKIDTSHLQPGDRAGLSLLEQYFGYIAVYKDADGQHIVRAVNKNGSLVSPSEDITDTVPGVNGTTLWLQARCDITTNTAQFLYSTDGKAFTPVGDSFRMHFTLTTFQGDRFGIFNYNPNGSDGWLDVDYFHQDGADGPTLSAAPGENPILRDVFTADPAPLLYKDTVYLYVGHDEAKGKEMFTMKEWLCYSSQDMKHWTPHGPIMRPTDFKWAVRDAWASQVAEKNGKFYLYVTVQHDNTHPGKAIGVAVADSPTGPFRDARGSALITDSTTPSPNPWDDIDPTILIDEDGTAWLAWGNPNCYLAKLKPNMIELDGPIQKIDVPYYTEGPWLHKRGNLYYLTYAAFAHQGQSEKICYATAPAITGPWTYRGILTGNAKNSYTIHPGIIEFKNQWYLFYHNAALTINDEHGALGRRSVCVEYLYYNPDGTMQPVIQTTEGVSVPPRK